MRSGRNGRLQGIYMWGGGGGASARVRGWLEWIILKEGKKDKCTQEERNRKKKKEKKKWKKKWQETIRREMGWVSQILALNITSTAQDHLGAGEGWALGNRRKRQGSKLTPSFSRPNVAVSLASVVPFILN